MGVEDFMEMESRLAEAKRKGQNIMSKFSVFNRSNEFMGFVEAEDAGEALNKAITEEHDWKAEDVHHVEEQPEVVHEARGRA